MQQDSDATSAILQNIIIIGAVGLAIFAYLLFLIRKRWKKGFLHEVDQKKKEEE
jgi:hypothetical protein